MQAFCSEKVTRLTEGHGEEFLTYHLLYQLTQ